MALVIFAGIGDLMHSTAAAVLLADDRPKTYWSGTHRTAPPSETLAKLRPHFQHMGLTRLAEVTGLDRIGLPVVQAIRPMARNLSVNQGKGQSLADAEVSAAMESAETWHAESAPGATIRGSYAGLSGAALVLDPRDLAEPAAAELEDQTAPLTWIEGIDLLSGAKILVPADAVLMDYSVPPETSCISRSSNGLASGNTRAEALAAALFEVIERDALADFHAMSASMRVTRLVKRDAVRSVLRSQAEAIEAAGLWLDVWDIRNDLGVPSYLAELGEPQGKNAGYRIARAAGSGAHFAPRVALSRAVNEAVQSRLTMISGVREDIEPSAYGCAKGPGGMRVSEAMFADQAALDFDETDASGASAGEDVKRAADRIAECRKGPIAVVDLTRDEVGLPVVRVVVPGLAQVCGPDLVRPASRDRREPTFV